MIYRTVSVPTREEEVALARRIQAGDIEARNELVERNMPLAVDFVQRFRLQGDDDAYQEAAMGLQEAADRFDPDAGSKFSTYAVYWITLKLVRWRQAKGHLIRLPDYMRYEGKDRQGSRMKYRPHADRARSVAHFDASTEEVHYHEPRPWESMEREEEAGVLHAALSRLPAHLRAVLVRHYGLDGHDGVTLADIGRSEGVSREWIRKLEWVALRKLRVLIEGGELPMVEAKQTVRECVVCGGEYLLTSNYKRITCTPRCAQQLRDRRVAETWAAKGRRA